MAPNEQLPLNNPIILKNCLSTKESKKLLDRQVNDIKTLGYKKNNNY